MTDDVFEELKGSFMEVYDDNKDGKIDIREMAQLLPMEENFLLLFRFDNPLESSVEFMKVQTTNTNINLFRQEIQCSCGISMTRMEVALLRLMSSRFIFIY